MAAELLARIPPLLAEANAEYKKLEGGQKAAAVKSRNALLSIYKICFDARQIIHDMGEKVPVRHRSKAEADAAEAEAKVEAKAAAEPLPLAPPALERQDAAAAPAPAPAVAAPETGNVKKIRAACKPKAATA